MITNNIVFNNKCGAEVLYIEEIKLELVIKIKVIIFI